MASAIVPDEVWNSFVSTLQASARANLTGNVVLKINFQDGVVSSWDAQCGQHGTCGKAGGTVWAVAVTT